MTERGELSAEQWAEVGDLLADLYSIVDRLEALFCDRKFTPDGHIVGSLGEMIAASMFALKLLAASAPAHDAETKDGRKVQVKFTQGANRVGLRAKPKHLLVLRLTPERCVDVVYNGPGHRPWSESGKKQSNGQKFISLKRLRELDGEVPDDKRLRRVVPSLKLGR